MTGAGQTRFSLQRTICSGTGLFVDVADAMRIVGDGGKLRNGAGACGRLRFESSAHGKVGIQAKGAFSGAPAEINREAGGTFSLFGGLIVGRNVELVPKERIVQAWRPANWEPGVYTLAKFELQELGPQTRIVLDHTGFPEQNFRHLNYGWYSHYWEPLKKYLA